MTQLSLTPAQRQLFALLPADQTLPTGHPSVLHLLASLDENDPLWTLYGQHAAKKIPTAAWSLTGRDHKTALRVALEAGKLFSASQLIHWGANPWALGEGACDLDHLDLHKAPSAYQGLGCLFQSLDGSSHRTLTRMESWLGRFYSSQSDVTSWQWVHSQGFNPLVLHTLFKNPLSIPWQHWIPKWGISPEQILGGGETWAAAALKSNDFDSLRLMVKSGHTAALQAAIQAPGWQGAEWAEWAQKTTESWFGQTRISPYYFSLIWALIPETIRTGPYVHTPSDYEQAMAELTRSDSSLPLETTFWEDAGCVRWVDLGDYTKAGAWILGMMDLNWPKALEAAQLWAVQAKAEEQWNDEIMTFMAMTLHSRGQWVEDSKSRPEAPLAFEKKWMFFIVWLAQIEELDLLESEADGFRRSFQCLEELKAQPGIYSPEKLNQIQDQLQIQFRLQEKKAMSESELLPKGEPFKKRL